MTRNHEKLLIGLLAGIIIVGAGAFAIQPALAGKAGAATLPGPAYPVLDLKLSPQA